MHIVIPMSGFGERFRDAGYTVPKPLIEVEGLPIIAHVIQLFPSETQFTFICNEAHMANSDYQMAAILQQYCPTGTVITVASHRLGPVYAVLQACDAIPDEEEVIVNYCDFTCDWDYAHFKAWLARVRPAGCIPAYRGFHPHSLGSTYYAYMKHNNFWLEDIQEKQPYTDTPMNEMASSGTYYFASGALMKQYFERAYQEGLTVNNEYYVSMVYKPMLADACQIAVYELDHFMQWGTPQDLSEYCYWSKVFRGMMEPRETVELTGTLLMPMVGLGSRFQQAGYRCAKPLVEVSGGPLYYQAVKALPKMTESVFVLREDAADYDVLREHVVASFPDAGVATTSALTDGQASSCMLASDQLTRDTALLISACDNSVLFCQRGFQSLIDSGQYDIIALGAVGYPNAKRYPQMYGWIETEADGVTVKRVSVKRPLDSMDDAPIIVGTFWFKNPQVFYAAYNSLVQENDTVNGEYYVDSCINHANRLGYRCAVFNVDAYICWGTPVDLQTFEYWQGCFHYWASHPYRIDCDDTVPTAVADQLIERYHMGRSSLPKGVEENV